MGAVDVSSLSLGNLHGQVGLPTSMAEAVIAALECIAVFRVSEVAANAALHRVGNWSQRDCCLIGERDASFLQDSLGIIKVTGKQLVLVPLEVLQQGNTSRGVDRQNLKYNKLLAPSGKNYYK